VGAAALTPPLSAVPGFCCRPLATACNRTLSRLGLPPPRTRFPLRSACLADGPFPRATERLAGGGCRPTSPLPAAHDLSCRRLAIAGKEALGSLAGGGCSPHPRFPLRSACLADGSLPRATIAIVTPAAASNLPRRCTAETAVEIFVTLTDSQTCLYSQSHYISVPISRITPPPPPAPSRSSKKPLPGGLAGASHRPGTHSKPTGTWQ
jgi:hypothetical protein